MPWRRHGITLGICILGVGVCWFLWNDYVDVMLTLVAESAPYLLIGFARGFRNAISRCRKHRRKGQKPVHIRTASVRNRHINNSLFECQNGTVRNRIKTVRGFNSENPALLFLFTTHYNFVRPHMGINGKTPAEAMGIRVDGDDKWATLLAFASAC